MKYFFSTLGILLLISCVNTNEVSLSETFPQKEMFQSESLNTTNTMNDEINVLQTKVIEPEENCFLFDDFTGSVQNRWGIVNDGVMGGRSLGNGDIQNNVLVFSGTIVTRGGGFSSLRGFLESGILTEYSSVQLRAKSDGREYRVTFRDNNRRGISHRAIIDFKNPGEFEEIIINFEDLEPAYFGRIVNAAAFNKETAREIGVILSDGVDGAFQLEIDEVKFCK